MQINRQVLVSQLRVAGHDASASCVEQQLPEQVDTDRDRDALSRCGVDVDAVRAQLAGGGATSNP